ncbi:hypothetical protein B0H17DRAFT_354594 [Mycena rosella]|uniref:Uncharacterized protein n=1 Tax=Mycena rosella TaxID=1033263 RepID=A0AAD7CPZ9_MYCRO|nr:hypothetical protein B0H17DRAFT_354594 [Mycena rosella]
MQMQTGREDACRRAEKMHAGGRRRWDDNDNEDDDDDEDDDGGCMKNVYVRENAWRDVCRRDVTSRSNGERKRAGKKGGQLAGGWCRRGVGARISREGGGTKRRRTDAEADGTRLIEEHRLVHIRRRREEHHAHARAYAHPRRRPPLPTPTRVAAPTPGPRIERQPREPHAADPAPSCPSPGYTTRPAGSAEPRHLRRRRARAAAAQRPGHAEEPHAVPAGRRAGRRREPAHRRRRGRARRDVEHPRRLELGVVRELLLLLVCELTVAAAAKLLLLPLARARHVPLPKLHPKLKRRRHRRLGRRGRQRRVPLQLPLQLQLQLHVGVAVEPRVLAPLPGLVPVPVGGPAIFVGPVPASVVRVPLPRLSLKPARAPAAAEPHDRPKVRQREDRAVEARAPARRRRAARLLLSVLLRV